MTDFEPYVREPAEHPPRRRLESRRATVAALAVLLLVASVAWLLYEQRAVQDPALEAPAGQEPTLDIPAEDDPRLTS